jgi:hypothetical protein
MFTTPIAFTAIKHDMRNRAEGADKETLAPASTEICVPGLTAALAELREAYPYLSDECLARILGLPTKKDQAPGASASNFEQVTK